VNLAAEAAILGGFWRHD